MPLFDRVKSQATQVAQQAAEKAKAASQAGQAKIDEIQQKRQLDGLYRDLGALVYAERTGKASAGDPETMNQLIAQITSLEESEQSGQSPHSEPPAQSDVPVSHVEPTEL